jgi:hypothetical protein
MVLLIYPQVAAVDPDWLNSMAPCWAARVDFKITSVEPRCVSMPVGPDVMHIIDGGRWQNRQKWQEELGVFAVLYDSEEANLHVFCKPAQVAATTKAVEERVGTARNESLCRLTLVSTMQDSIQVLLQSGAVVSRILSVGEKVCDCCFAVFSGYILFVFCARSNASLTYRSR